MMEQRRLGVTMVLKCWGLSGLLHELFCTYCNIIICESVSSYISGFVYDLGCFPLKFFLKRGFLPEVLLGTLRLGDYVVWTTCTWSNCLVKLATGHLRQSRSSPLNKFSS